MKTVALPALPRFAELQAPEGWATVDIIADLHLQGGERGTFGAWKRYMNESPADAIFILGDLFEVWVGDDAAADSSASFEAECASVILEAARTRAVFFMHGNRDFLLGDGFAAQAGFTLLNDPTTLTFAHRRWLLTHGDALCVADVDYMKFRAEVRTTEWQTSFLARPLDERRAFARQLREKSEALKKTGVTYADADTDLSLAWLVASDAQTMIHGHTHRPADHALAGGRLRVVLSDWDVGSSSGSDVNVNGQSATHAHARAQVLRLTSAGLSRIDLLAA